MDVRGNPSTKMARGAKLSLSRAIHLVFGVGLMAAAMGAAAQSCPGGSCPPINVYGGPISWGGGSGGGGGGGWFGGWDSSYYSDPGSYQQPQVACGDWERDHPRPDGCPSPPGPVTTNGCGPAGFGWLVPDGPFGAACNTHDTCYSQFNADRASCDSAFSGNMIQTCNDNYGCFYDHESGRVLCGDHVQLMQCLDYQQVVMNGMGSGFGAAVMQSRFASLQIEATCRAWYNARSVESTCAQ